MIIEHILYSTSLAIIVGMVYARGRDRDPSWLIIASVYAPDIDKILREGFGVILFSRYSILQQIPLHSVGVLVFFSITVGIVLLGSRNIFWETVFFAGIGYAAHLFEDALVYDPAYPFFWPFSSEIYSIGLIEYTPNVFGVADLMVLGIGILLVGTAIVIRSVYEGNGWVMYYVPVKIRALIKV
jgi:hypothetical protein